MSGKSGKSVKLNAVLNGIKEIMAILFPMITFPYVSNLLGSANYGVYTFSSSIVSYISYIAAAGIMRYAIREVARVRDDKPKCQKLVNEIFTINVITTVFAFVLLIGLVIFWPKLHYYAPVIFMLSLMIMFITFGADWINSAHEDYVYITIRYIISQSLALGLLFLLVRTPDDVVQYAFVTAFGVILPNIINRFHIRRKYGIKLKISINNELKKHIKPIAFLFACSIGTFIYINSDVTVLGIFFDDSVTGYYGVSVKFYMLIKQVVAAAFTVLIPRISHEMTKDGSKSKETLEKILHFTILTAVPAAVGLIMVRKNLIAVFPGEEYARSQSSLMILGLAIIPALLANFFINIVMIPMRLEKKVMYATLISAGINLALNIIFIPIFAENAAAVTTLVAEIVMVFLGWLWSRDQHLLGGVLKPIAVSAAGAAGIFGICYCATHYLNGALWQMIVAVAVSVVFYGVVLLIFYRKMIIDFIKNLKKKKSGEK